MHVPVDRLMTEVTKLIHEKNDIVQNLRGLLADISIRLRKEDEGKKEAVMKRDIEVLARDIFSGLESKVTAKERNILDKIPDVVGLIPEEDMRQFKALNLKPFECIAEELKKMKKTAELIEPILTITNAISDDLAKSRGGFVPLSPYFSHYMEQIENLRRASVRLSPQETHPTIYPFITQAVSLIAEFSVCVSSMSFAEAFAQDQKNLAEIISNAQDNDIKIADLTEELENQKRDMELLKEHYSVFIEANALSTEARHSKLAEIHEQEIAAIIEHNEKCEF